MKDLLMQKLFPPKNFRRSALRQLAFPCLESIMGMKYVKYLWKSPICEIPSRSTIKAPEQLEWHSLSVFIFNFRGFFRTHLNIYNGAFFVKIVSRRKNIWLGSQYASELWTDFTYWLPDVSIFFSEQENAGWVTWRY